MYLASCLIVLLVFFTNLASALTVQAKRIITNLQEETVTLQGPITIKGENLQLEAAKAITFFNDKLLKLQDDQFKRIELEGEPIKATYNGYKLLCKKIILVKRENKVILFEAKLEKDNYKLTAKRIEYDIKNNRIIAGDDSQDEILITHEEHQATSK